MCFVATCLLWVAFAVGVAALVARGVATPREALPDIFFALAMMSFAGVGAVIARRHPRNSVAWVLLGVGFAWEFGFFCDLYFTWGMTYPGTVPGALYAGVISAGGWVPGLAPLGTFLLLLFPDGHLPTTRWRWWAWFTGASLLWVYLLITFSPGQVSDDFPQVLNPLAIDALGALEPILAPSVMLVPFCIVGCTVALVRRFRRSTGIQRLQLKWFAAAAAMVAVVYGLTMVLSIPYDWAGTTPGFLGVLQNVALGVFLLIPLSVGVAILRHRLYDIDRIINRAVVYTGATILLAAVYIGGVVASQAVLRGVTGTTQNNLSVAASTLAVAALFRPVLTRVQGFVDRRFYRGKYDAARTVEDFSARLRQETDLEALTDQLRGVIAQTVQPAGVTLWIAGISDTATVPRQS